jgi:UDP-glucose 4-epimerase
MLLALQDAGEPHVALDTSSSITSPVPSVLSTASTFAHEPLRHTEEIAATFQKHDVKEVIHFAGSGFVASSLQDPLREYKENTLTAMRLVEACVQTGVERIVLSSTASVYGVPERMPIHERATINPISPYGASMAMAERIIADIARSAGIQFVILRYFNLAGADPEGRAGEGGKPRHLIKAIAQIVVGTRKEKLQIFGDDYETPDGTCIRDYVHVSDIANAHHVALQHLRDDGDSLTLNCGYGYGASVRDVIASVERVTGKEVDTEIAPRRAGDPPSLIADNAEIRTRLGWVPKYDDLDFIIRTAIDWEERCRKDAVA